MTAVARRLRRLIEKLACRARLAHDGFCLRRVLIISPRDARRALALGHARLILELAGSARNTPAATDAWHVRCAQARITVGIEFERLTIVFEVAMCWRVAIQRLHIVCRTDVW